MVATVKLPIVMIDISPLCANTSDEFVVCCTMDQVCLFVAVWCLGFVLCFHLCLLLETVSNSSQLMGLRQLF